MDERNHLFGNKTIREEKIDKHKVYNVSEMYIVTDTNKDFFIVSIVNLQQNTIIKFQRHKRLKLFHKSYYNHPFR